MSITTIILSKDRPAQLDLLLRSIERNGGGQFDPREIIYASEKHSDPGYGAVMRESGISSRWRFQYPDESEVFERYIRMNLDQAGEFVCFMCDDGILYRDYTKEQGIYPENFLSDRDTLCFSLRLGQNTTRCYPSDREQTFPGVIWNWTTQPQEPGQSDFGYPGSIDAHVFRTADVQRMLAGKSFPNPTALECALVAGCQEIAAERPLMACYPHSVYVGNPINRVSEQSGVRFGQTYPVTAAECNERFLDGERIDLDAMDFSQVNGAHTEIELVWK